MTARAHNQGMLSLHTEQAGEDAEIPFSLPLELVVRDSEVIAELMTHAEGAERQSFALNSLRIGVLALKQARGRIDADLVRRESERLMAELQRELGEHTQLVHTRLTGSLKEYFDPADGRFHERVNRLIQQDGELEQLLRRQVGSQDSELGKTLASHFGADSPLMKLLSPDQSRGLLASLKGTLDEQLRSQREHVLKEFSLDNKDGALSRLISELNETHGMLSGQLQDKIDELVQQFSLNDEGSALSQHVRNVERAQKTITSEFSLDDDSSALARLKRELLTLITDQRDMTQKFQEEVKVALESMAVRKREMDKSTRHGLEFEDAVFEFLQREANRAGDVASATGQTTGLIKNCKVGDCLIELGPDTAAPCARIVVEAKEKAGWQLAAARAELETARKNRDAQVGLFVFSKKTAGQGLEPLCRFGHDVFIVWDAEDAGTDVYLRVGISLARALCVRNRTEREGRAVDFSDIDAAVLEIEKRASTLEEVITWTSTIQSNSEKILNKIRATRKSLEEQAELLRERTDAFKDLLSNHATET
jgi:hypothetical protein